MVLDQNRRPAQLCNAFLGHRNMGRSKSRVEIVLGARAERLVQRSVVDFQCDSGSRRAGEPAMLQFYRNNAEVLNICAG